MMNKTLYDYINNDAITKNPLKFTLVGIIIAGFFILILFLTWKEMMRGDLLKEDDFIITNDKRTPSNHHLINIKNQKTMICGCCLKENTFNMFDKDKKCVYCGTKLNIKEEDNNEQ